MTVFVTHFIYFMVAYVFVYIVIMHEYNNRNNVLQYKNGDNGPLLFL